MKIGFQLHFRAIVAALAGLSLLLEAVNSEFLRSPFQAWTTMINLFIAMFGAIFLIQSWVFIRQFQTARWRQSQTCSEPDPFRPARFDLT